MKTKMPLSVYIEDWQILSQWKIDRNIKTFAELIHSLIREEAKPEDKPNVI